MPLQHFTDSIFMPEYTKQPGWYADSQSEPIVLRYWDGYAWTDDTKSLDDSNFVKEAVIGQPNNSGSYTPDFIKNIEKVEEYKTIKFRKKRSLVWMLVKLFILADFLGFIFLIVVPIYPELYELFKGQFEHVNDEFIRVGAPMLRGWLQDIGVPVKG